jgi:ABC-type sugar transport system ATPase subunit
VATLGVRPEHVRLSAGGDARVLAVDDLGHERIAEVDLLGHVLAARLPAGSALHRGDLVRVELAQWRGFDANGIAV